VALALFFLYNALPTIPSGITNHWLGIDARIYLDGSAAWLHGARPWDQVEIGGGPKGAGLNHYSALPTAVILLAPLALLPIDVGEGILIAVGIVSAIFIVRRLELPWYWLAFPPMTEGLVSANPSIPLLALLLIPAGRPIAPLLKVYRFAPLLGERDRRSLAIAVGLFALTLFAWPLWVDYFSDIVLRSLRLIVEAQGGFSAQGNPMIVLAVLSLAILAWLRDWRALGWLSVIAIWPATEFHYSTFALPVMHPILAFGLAVRDPTLTVPVLGVYSTWRLARSRGLFAQVPRSPTASDAPVMFRSAPE
jgi:hypothetical protein